MIQMCFYWLHKMYNQQNYYHCTFWSYNNDLKQKPKDLTSQLSKQKLNGIKNYKYKWAILIMELRTAYNIGQ